MLGRSTAAVQTGMAESIMAAMWRKEGMESQMIAPATLRERECSPWKFGSFHEPNLGTLRGGSSTLQFWDTQWDGYSKHIHFNYIIHNFQKNDCNYKDIILV
jgi:hypothetical protein